MKLLKLEISEEASKFLVIGGLGYIIDVGLFNLLSLIQIESSGSSEPIVNKVISTSIAITFTYLGNSRWTFKKRTGRPEGINRISRYLAVNLIGMGIVLVFLATSRYVLGFESLLADNISANVFGTGAAMIFRFLANRYWVFTKSGGDGGI